MSDDYDFSALNETGFMMLCPFSANDGIFHKWFHYTYIHLLQLPLQMQHTLFQSANKILDGYIVKEPGKIKQNAC